MHHFSWFHYLFPRTAEIPDHVLTAGFATLLIIIISLTACFAAGKPEAAVIPHKGVSIRGFFEVLVEFLYNLVEGILGHKGAKKFVPLFLGPAFLYLLINNLIGLIPGFTPATENFNTNFAIGILSFALYNIWGLIDMGPAKYMAHFFGPKELREGGLGMLIIGIVFGVVMFAIEIVSHAIRPITLSLRVTGNMMGDHSVLGAMISVAPWVVPMVFYVLGLFVCFMQAFVFTILSTVYILLATHHEEEGHH